MDPSAARCTPVLTPTQPHGWAWEPPQHTQDVNHSATDQDMPDTDAPSTAASDVPPRLTRSEQTLRMVSAQFAHLLAEALDGKRRLAQLQALFDPICLATLAHRVTVLRGASVRLASVHVQPTSDESAEVTVRLATPHLDHAAALRVTRRCNQWVCTALAIG